MIDRQVCISKWDGLVLEIGHRDRCRNACLFHIFWAKFGPVSSRWPWLGFGSVGGRVLSAEIHLGNTAG